MAGRGVILAGAVVVAASLWACAPALAGQVSAVDGRLHVLIDDPKGDIVDIWPEGLAHEVYSVRGIGPGTGCFAYTVHWLRCDANVMRIAVDGGPGNDRVGAWDVLVPVAMDGGAGADLLESGVASDSLAGGDGVDALAAGDGDDLLEGGANDDYIETGKGSDNATGDDGNDVLEAGDSRNDVLRGGDGLDLLRGGAGDGLLAGGAGDDVLVAGAGADEMDGGTGTNTILGVTANDELDCSSKDHARTRRGLTVKGCSPVPERTAVPREWPPRDAEASAATLRPNDPGMSAVVRRKGNARRYTVTVSAGKSNQTKRRWACIHIYDYPEKRIKRFSKKVRVKHSKTYKRPQVPPAGWYARVLRGKCS